MFIEPRSEVLIQLLSERHSISLLKELRVVMAFAAYINISVLTDFRT